MKLKQLLIVCLLTIAGIASAQTYLTQDFSSSIVVSDYVNASAPSNGQWNAISTSGAGTTWSINSGRLRVVRTGNAGAMSRTTDFSPTPSHLLVKFDLSVPASSLSGTNAATFQIGSAFGTANSNESTANCHSRLGINLTTSANQFSLRDIVGGTSSSNFTGTQSISWYINNSGSSITYTGPDGNSTTLANDRADVWVGTTNTFNDIAATTATQTLTDFKFVLSNGNTTIDLDNFSITPIPQASIIVNPSSLSGFTTIVGTPSTEQSYTVSGSNLSPATGNISVAAVTGFEYSLTSGGTFTSTLNIPYTGGGLSTTTVYVRLSGASPGSFSGNATNSGGGATAQNVALSGTVNSLTPFLSATPTSLSGFTNITGTASAAQTYNLSGTNLSPSAGSISITAPTNFEVSNNGSTWGTTTTATYTAGGTFTTPTVYVRVAASAPAGSVSGNVNNNGGGAPDINVAVSGTVNPVPVLTASPTSLSGFSTITGTASTAQTFNLSSTTLLPASGTITVTAPTNFEVSLNGSSYASSVNATYTSGGTFSNPTVYVRIAASAPVGSPSGNITTSGGTVASPPSVAVSGTVAPQPSIVVSPTSLTGFVTPQGTPSAAQSYTLTGANLNPSSGNLAVAAVTGFEYCLTVNGTYTSTLTIPYTGGAISTTVFVRLTGTTANSYSGNAVNSGGGATAQNVALSGTVNPGPPFVVINKVYNDGVSASNDEIELLVINNNADLRGLIFKDYSSNGNSDGGGVFTLTNNAVWNNIPAGTLIRITGQTTAPDIDPTDFSMTLGRANTTYFTQNIGAFDISQNEIVMLKAAGSSTSGSSGAIATLALGSAYTNTNYTGAPGYKINTNGGAIGTSQYGIAINATSTINDFNGTAGASITSSQVFLEPNNSTNSVYICTLRGSNAEPTATATGINFTAVGPNTITVNWTNAVSNGGARRIVVARLQSTTAIAPTDGQTYNANTLFGSGATTGANNFVVFNGTGTSVAVTGLASGTLYSFDIYEYNGQSFCANYLNTPLSGNRNTTSATTVQFVSASATISEGIGTYNVTLSITNPSATNATTGQINFLSTDPGTSGQAADINSFNIGTFTFPAGSSANQTVAITITDDVLFEANETFVFDLQNVAGGTNAQEGTPNSFTLTITDNESVGTIIYSTGSGNASTDAIWSFNPAGPGQTIGALPGGFQSGRDVVIQSGHSVIFASGPIDVKDLTIQSGGRAYRNSNSPTLYVFFNVYGNVIINGTLGNTTNSLDGIGLNIEGTNCNITGSGTANIARIRKAFTTNSTSNLTISRNMNLWHDGTSIHNEAANGTTFNVTIAAGITVNALEFNGSIAVDGVDGYGTGNNYGSFIINGNLNLGGYLYMSNNNGGTGACSFTFGSTSVVRTSIMVSELTTGNGTTATFNTGAKIYVSEYLDLVNGTLNTNNNIVIVSDATNTAYIDNFTTGYNGTINGTVTVQRYVPSGANGFRYIGAPVNSGSGSLALSNISGFVASGNPGQVIPLPTCDPNNTAVNSPYGNLMYWNEAGPFTVSGCKQSGWFFQTSGNLTIGRGYGAKIAPGTTINYNGNPNTGTISLGTLSRTNATGNGWHLVSNPYPSAIRISNIDGTSTNNMPSGFQGQIQFFQPNGPYSGTYQPANAGSANVDIALGQAFWVQTNTSGTWSLTNNYRTYNSPTYYNEHSPVLSHLLVDVSGNGFKDKTEINFIADAENGFDFYDANKWEGRGEQPMLYTKVGNELAAINSLPAIESTVLVPMGFKPGQNGNYTFDFQDIATFPLSAMLYLEDRKENTIVNLREHASYSFASSVNDDIDRFIIRFEPPVTIAIADQTCEDKGALTITQNGSTQWDNYTVTDNNNITYATGTNFTGSISVGNLNPQEYIVTLNHFSGYTAQEYVTVSGVEQLATTLVASTNTTQVDQLVTFTATTIGNPTSYTWNFGDGNILVSNNNTENHAYDLAGNYTVTVTAANDNCENSVQKTISVNTTTTNINELNANGVKVFGMGNHIVIEFDNQISEEANITLFNMLGQNLASFSGVSTLKGRAELNVNHLKPGYYIIQIAINGQLISRKLVLGNN